MSGPISFDRSLGGVQVAPTAPGPTHRVGNWQGRVDLPSCLLADPDAVRGESLDQGGGFGITGIWRDASSRLKEVRDAGDGAAEGAAWIDG